MGQLLGVPLPIELQLLPDHSSEFVIHQTLVRALLRPRRRPIRRAARWARRISFPRRKCCPRRRPILRVILTLGFHFHAGSVALDGVRSAE